MKVLFDNVYRFNNEGIDRIKDLGYEVTLLKEDSNILDTDSLDYDVLVCNGEASNINILKFDKLKFLQLTSAGFDKLPIKDIKNKGTKIANAKGVYSIPIAEFTILKILEIYKQSRYFEEAQSNNQWKINRRLKELYGKTLGIIGTGSIASEIAYRAKVFGTKVIGLNTSGEDVEHFDKCLKPDNLNTLLRESDIVISTLPINDKTRNMINKDNLKFMKDEAILINISRGGIINERDLMDHLNEGKLMGVALDVFETEPLPEDSPLWNHPKVYITPHNSFTSDNIKERMFQLVYNNLKLFIEGKEIINEV